MTNLKKYLGFYVLVLFLSLTGSLVLGAAHEIYWIKVPAKDQTERSKIANLGVSIETVGDDYVIVLGGHQDVQRLEDKGYKIDYFLTDPRTLDFPPQDSNFRNYDRVIKTISDLQAKYPAILRTAVIGKSLEGRDIVAMTISTNPDNASTKPGIVFMGTHHAREHLSTETPLLLAQYFLEKYTSGDPVVKKLVEGREIFIVPLVNPDGAEFDVSSGSYQMWRKNRRDNGDGTFGVDLNRNYSFGWGTGGSSTDSNSDVYMGKTAFSEPETQTIRDFVTSHHNINILLTFHTFSQLILYPWGGKDTPVADQKDHDAFVKMADTMAQWNGYTAEQASQLYIASGDTCDWAYGELKIFAFTFELDPGSMYEGGFYPGQDYIPTVFDKNLKPALYLTDLADNPYRALSPEREFGFQTPLLK